MTEVTTEELKNEINSILKTADLTVVSAKKVREQVEKKFNCSLLNRKKEFDSIVMDFINQQQESSSSNESEKNVSDSDTKNKGKKHAVAPSRQAPKRKKRRSLNDTSGSGAETDSGSDSDYKVPKKTPKKNKSTVRNAGGRKSTGFTRAYNLSPELSALMGAESLPRHEVVKKVWALIKERNLYDPKNKQFAICDDELIKVMKVKRFRTFGMLKHLKPHFLG